MKCFKCKKSQLVESKVSDTVNIYDSLDVVVHHLEALQCPSCKSVLMSAKALKTRDQKVLAKLIELFKGDRSLGGGVALWIRKSIKLSAADLAKMTGRDPSSYSQAGRRDTRVDEDATRIIMLKARDFLKGDSTGFQKFEQFQKDYIEQLDSVEEPTSVGVRRS